LRADAKITGSTTSTYLDAAALFTRAPTRLQSVTKHRGGVTSSCGVRCERYEVTTVASPERAGLPANAGGNTGRVYRRQQEGTPPSCAVLAAEIVEELEASLAQITELATSLPTEDLG